MAKKSDEPSASEVERAKKLYVDGDYKGARALAKHALEQEELNDAAREEAHGIVASTRIATPSLVAGALMLLVVVVLFIWVLLRPHAH